MPWIYSNGLLRPWPLPTRLGAHLRLKGSAVFPAWFERKANPSLFGTWKFWPHSNSAAVSCPSGVSPSAPIHTTEKVPCPNHENHWACKGVGRPNMPTHTKPNTCNHHTPVLIACAASMESWVRNWFENGRNISNTCTARIASMLPIIIDSNTIMFVFECL